MVDLLSKDAASQGVVSLQDITDIDLPETYKRILIEFKVIYDDAIKHIDYFQKKAFNAVQAIQKGIGKIKFKLDTAGLLALDAIERKFNSVSAAIRSQSIAYEIHQQNTSMIMEELAMELEDEGMNVFAIEEGFAKGMKDLILSLPGPFKTMAAYMVFAGADVMTFIGTLQQMGTWLSSLLGNLTQFTTGIEGLDYALIPVTLAITKMGLNILTAGQDISTTDSKIKAFGVDITDAVTYAENLGLGISGVATAITETVNQISLVTSGVANWFSEIFNDEEVTSFNGLLGTNAEKVEKIKNETEALNTYSNLVNDQREQAILLLPSENSLLVAQATVLERINAANQRKLELAGEKVPGTGGAYAPAEFAWQREKLYSSYSSMLSSMFGTPGALGEWESTHGGTLQGLLNAIQSGAYYFASGLTSPMYNASMNKWGLPISQSYQTGGVVQETGPALVHAGETVLPPGVSPISINPTINIYGTSGNVAQQVKDEILRELRQMVVPRW